MDKKIKDELEAAIDMAIEKFKSDPDSIFDSDKERLILKHSGKEKINAWKKNKKCIFDNCPNKSIAKSHSIQKSSSIKQISENSHVLTPKFSDQDGEIELISVGINEASTFPGFCQDHEKLFEEFESNKDLTSEVHFILQMYRTICREIVIAEKNVSSLRKEMNKYNEFRDNKIESFFIEELGEKFLLDNNIKPKGLRSEGLDPKQNQAESLISSTDKYLSSLQELKNAIGSDIKKGKFQKIECVTVAIDVEFPVCVAGRGNFHHSTTTSKTKNVETIFNVLPHEGKTYIVICVLKKFTKQLRDYIEFRKHPLQIISLIESWMIHGSDHWFIKPSEWDKIDKPRARLILDDILDLTKNIGFDYKYSILDDMRKSIIKDMDANISLLSPDLIEFLEIERKKLSL